MFKRALLLIALTLSLSQILPYSMEVKASPESSPNSSQDIPQKLISHALSSFIREGKVIYALTYKNAPHWHTYWKNPGDAGIPTKIEILTKGLTLEEYEWPVPSRYIEQGDILTYGNSDEYTRFFSFKERELPPQIKISSTWLICKHLCIPGKVEISATLDSQGQVISSSPQDFQISPQRVLQRFQNLPQASPWPEELDIILKKGKKDLSLNFYYNYASSPQQKLFHNLGLLTPFRQPLLDTHDEKLYRNSAGHFFGKMNAQWDGEYAEPEVPFPQDGLFEKPLKIKFLFQDPQSQKVKVLEKEFKSYDLMPGDTIESLMKMMDFIEPQKLSPGLPQEKAPSPPNAPLLQGERESSSSLLIILFFAFIGGLILNVMPCVLPVISLKLFGLISHSEESKSTLFRHNLFYTLGVLATFLILALTILSLKSMGENVGWGFQLQSPSFIALMIILLFSFSLNLFDLYEFKTPGGKTLGDLPLRRGVFGDFLSGVLATILSTPCSAPFLGTALTFAFTSSALHIILIFQAIGLGLSFPFLATALFPKSIKFLPRPGIWMNHVKKFLGLSLLLTTLWLMDIFLSLTTGNTPLLSLLVGLTFLFFALYFQRFISHKWSWRLLFWALPLLLFGKLFFSSPMLSPTKDFSETSLLLREKNAKGKLYWQQWSEEKMEKYRQGGKTTFIDFTAKWCLTCKVNEKLVLETKAFRELIEENNIQLLLGDWTKYNPKIGDFLKRHGHVGVPAYFLQTKEGVLHKLGETISIQEIRDHLEISKGKR